MDNEDLEDVSSGVAAAVLLHTIYQTIKTVILKKQTKNNNKQKIELPKEVKVPRCQCRMNTYVLTTVIINYSFMFNDRLHYITLIIDYIKLSLFIYLFIFFTASQHW